MKLVKFSVERYRSIIKRSQFSIFDKTVIVGPNNEGKSNIMRALVCALNLLKVFAAYPHRLQKEGKTILYAPTILGSNDIYSWYRDYPIPLQTTRGEKENKKTIFILEFGLNKTEFNDFKALTQTTLKHSIIPIRLEVNGNNFRFTLNIPGPFYKNASVSKMIQIAKFITEKINICYIDAERTAETAEESIGNMLDLQIRKTQEQEQYKSLLRQLKEVYSPGLEEMSTIVNDLLKSFIPSIKETKISLLDRYYDQRVHYGHSFSVTINDGVNTPLNRKGSGVQSMVALFLAQYVSTSKQRYENFILAIDEPESHLHPQGIHHIKNILDDIALKNQVIIATHSPLLVQTSDPHKNIIVKDNCASEAKRIDAIRKILGVHAADNLLFGEFVLVVEGASDERILTTLLSEKSDIIKKALNDKLMTITNVHGCSKISPLLSYVKDCICKYHIVLDNDSTARSEYQKLIDRKQISTSDVTFWTFSGFAEAEIEDLFNPEVYMEKIKMGYGFSSDGLNFLCKTNAKWSDRMRTFFSSQGVVWDEKTELNVKSIVADCVADKGLSAILSCRDSVFSALASKVEHLLKDI